MKNKLKNLRETHDLYWKNAPKKQMLDKYWGIAISRSRYLVSRLKDINFDSIYEIGYFSGRNLYYIREEFPNIRIGGADICVVAKKYANSKVNNVELETTDINSLNGEKWDIVFTMGTLIHVVDIDDALERCVKKASKYVIHIEANDNDHVFCGPESINPEVKSTRFEWFPNIYERYLKMGLDVTCEKMPEGVWARDTSHFIMVRI